MNILIIGGSSSIGRALGAYLSATGHTVCGTCRGLEFTALQHPWLKKIFHYTLGGAIERSMFEDIDLVLHLAHDFRPHTAATTIRGTKELYAAAKQLGVDRQLYCSSCAARPDALSEYGRTKHALEGFFQAEQALVIRPGLVLGQGGLYKRMAGLLRQLPLIPVPNGGDMIVPVIDEQTLCQAVAAIIVTSRSATRPYNLFHPEQVPIKHLLRLTADALNRRPLFIPLPSRLLLMPLAGMARLNIPTPISVDNLKGLMLNSTASDPSDLGKIGFVLPAVDLMIHRAASQFRRA